MICIWGYGTFSGMKNHVARASLSVFLFFCGAPAHAADEHVATVTKLAGKVELFVPVDLYPQATGAHATFNDRTYRIRLAELGAKVLDKMIVSTDKKSKLKLVYQNGDQIYVTPATKYEVNWQVVSAKEKVEIKPTTMKLIHGALRMILEKDGPRKGSTVETKSASFAVRGTDFHVEERGSSQRSQVTVLRGLVVATAAVNQRGALAEIEVRPGASATVSVDGSAKLLQATKAELKEIASDSRIENTVALPAVTIPEVVRVLEQRAKDVVVKDIQAADPEMLRGLSSEAVGAVEELNEKVIDRIYQTAPQARLKPSLRELNEPKPDPYNEYLKKN